MTDKAEKGTNVRKVYVIHRYPFCCGCALLILFILLLSFTLLIYLASNIP